MLPPSPRSTFQRPQLWWHCEDCAVRWRGLSSEGTCWICGKGGIRWGGPTVMPSGSIRPLEEEAHA